MGPSERISGTSVQPFLTPDGRAARYVLVSDTDPLSPAAVRDLAQLQARMPELVSSAGLGDASVEYAGQTALAQSAVDAVSGDALKIALAVLLVNLVLMALFMRALLAPLVLLAVNVLSVAATLGLTVWFFQDVLGYPDITYYVPFAGAVLLVSLSSDYNVLIVGKIWAEGENRPMRDAIATAAPRASRAIRAAGLSLAASFALVALIPIRSFRELAAVMSVGILVETFLVRSLLAPALLALLGRRARWPGRFGVRRFVRPRRGHGPDDQMMHAGRRYQDMGENIDQMKGTAKEKAGQLKDDPDLEAEGKRDQAKGDLKEGVDNAADKIKSGVDKVTP